MRVRRCLPAVSREPPPCCATCTAPCTACLHACLHAYLRAHTQHRVDCRLALEVRKNVVNLAQAVAEGRTQDIWCVVSSGGACCTHARCPSGLHTCRVNTRPPAACCAACWWITSAFCL
ncbi:hypothetical protein EON67_05095 [archaeon]|nr:MAG: hypothetical protein EON67_05095 [archaeon]